MNAGGAVLVILGVWTVVQVLGGRALQRLGIIHDPGGSTPATGQSFEDWAAGQGLTKETADTDSDGIVDVDAQSDYLYLQGPGAWG